MSLPLLFCLREHVADLNCRMLILIGVVYRIIAYLGLVLINRKRQR